MKKPPIMQFGSTIITYNWVFGVSSILMEKFNPNLSTV